MGSEFLGLGQYCRKQEELNGPCTPGSQTRNSQEEGGWGLRDCLSFQTYLPSLQTGICSTSLFSFAIFTWCLRPDLSTNSFYWNTREVLKRRRKESLGRERQGKQNIHMSVSMFSGAQTYLGKWFFARDLWCQIVEWLPVIYDSFFITSFLMRQIKTNPHSFPESGACS